MFCKRLNAVKGRPEKVRGKAVHARATMPGERWVLLWQRHTKPLVPINGQAFNRKRTGIPCTRPKHAVQGPVTFPCATLSRNKYVLEV